MADKEFRVQNDTLKKLIDMRDGTFSERVAASSAHSNGMAWLEAVSLGLLSPGVRPARAFGKNPDVDSASVPEYVWTGGETYPWMTAATSLEVLSDNVNDTSAGTGARTLTIEGLDINYVEQSDLITLNGITPVAVPRQYYRINRVEIETAGPNRLNIGIINVRDSGGGTVRAIVPADIGLTQQAIFTVPAGHTLLINSTLSSINQTSGANKNITISTLVGFPSGASRRLLQFSVSSSSPFNLGNDVRFPLPEKTDVALLVIFSDTNNVDMTAGFSGVLVNNSVLPAA